MELTYTYNGGTQLRDGQAGDLLVEERVQQPIAQQHRLLRPHGTRALEQRRGQQGRGGQRGDGGRVLGRRHRESRVNMSWEVRPRGKIGLCQYKGCGKSCGCAVRLDKSE